AGGKRLRPLLCFLTAPGAPSVAAGVAVEMVHMATLVHDDLVDGARLRRGLPAAWSVYGADAAKAAGDYLYACAFAVLAETGDERAVKTLADAALCLARGEAMQKLQTNDPDTPIEAYLERCALKTGKLIEAGGPLDGALVRVAATDAIALAGEQALAYAAKARSHLSSQRHREELEILTDAVVDRPG